MDHHALMADKVRYGALGAAFARAADLSTANMFHVYLDRLAFLDAPLVSFVHALPKAGKGADALAAPLAALNARPVPAGGRPGGGAKAVEKDEFVELYGWDDVKVRWPGLWRGGSADRWRIRPSRPRAGRQR